MTKPLALIGLCLSSVALSNSVASAEDRPVSVGPYTQIGMGAKGLLGENSAHAAEGVSFDLHAGTDLFQWLSVGGYLDISSHEATVPPPPEGEYLQLYGGGAEARLSLSFGPVVIFGEGSIGYAAVSTNILEKVDLLEPGEQFSPTLGGGGGLEYQLQNRHFALGLSGRWTVYAAFEAMQTASAQAHLRYTY